MALTTLPNELTAESEFISSSVLDAPLRAISSRVITVTGKAPSASTRLIDEPVISTRCWASVGELASTRLPPKASIKLRHSIVFLNMRTPRKEGKGLTLKPDQAPGLGVSLHFLPDTNSSALGIPVFASS